MQNRVLLSVWIVFQCCCVKTGCVMDGSEGVRLVWVEKCSKLYLKRPLKHPISNEGELLLFLLSRDQYCHLGRRLAFLIGMQRSLVISIYNRLMGYDINHIFFHFLLSVFLPRSSVCYNLYLFFMQAFALYMCALCMYTNTHTHTHTHTHNFFMYWEYKFFIRSAW